MTRAFFSLLILLITTFHSIAQLGDRSVLRVSLSDGSPLTLAVDERYFERHNTMLTVGDLPPGRHSLKVYAYSPNRRRYGSRADLLFNGRVRIDPATFNNCIVDVDHGTISMNVSDRVNNVNSVPPPPRDDIYPNSTKPEQIQKEPKHNELDNEVEDPRGKGMGKEDIKYIKQEVSEKITDTDKLSLLKSRLKGRKYNSAQVRIMMTWLNFEHSRLELAKFAYKHVSDKGNYSKVSDDLSLDSSKEELKDFIKSK
ncbi:MAG: DUF4476 domain-containing protein [Bacteroidota bacterium]